MLLRAETRRRLPATPDVRSGAWGRVPHGPTGPSPGRTLTAALQPPESGTMHLVICAAQCGVLPHGTHRRAAPRSR